MANRKDLEREYDIQQAAIKQAENEKLRRLLRWVRTALVHTSCSKPAIISEIDAGLRAYVFDDN